jgi:tetratricopeptide (TPR) repeat protein
MVHNGLGVWIAWDGLLDPAFEGMFDEFGGFRMAEDSGQALWFFFGDEGLRVLARIDVWGRVNAMPVFVEAFPATMLVSPKFERSLSMSVELSRQHATPSESLSILVHPNLKNQMALIPGLSSTLAKPSSGLARVPFERLEADPVLTYDSGFGWLCVIRPLGDPFSRDTAEGWRNIAVELLNIIERLGFKFIRHEGFLIFEISGLRLFRNWNRETISRIMRLKAEGDQGHYWPSVMAVVSSKGRTLSKDLPRRLSLDWDQLTPDYPHMSYRTAFLLGDDYAIHEARSLSRGVTVDDWCNVSLIRAEEESEPQGVLAVPLPTHLSGGDAKICFYCGLNNHSPKQCPSKTLDAPQPEVWDRFGQLDIGRLDELSQNLDTALAEDPLGAMTKRLSGGEEMDLLLQVIFEVGLPCQTRMLDIVWRSKAKELPVGATPLGPKEGESLGGAFAALREHSEATYEEQMLQALTKYPRAFQPKSLQGFWAMEGGDWIKAVYYWQEAGRLCQTALQRCYFLYLQARAMEVQGDYHKAIALYREALRECPKWIEPVYRQGVCLVKMGFTDQGLQLFYPFLDADSTMFNRIMVDPELERGRLHVLSALWRIWQDAREKANARLAELTALSESIHERFLEGEPYRAEADGRILELTNLGKVNNYAAFKRLGLGIDAFTESSRKKIAAEIKAMQHNQMRQFDDLKDVQHEAAWFPFPTLLREFNLDFNFCATKLNWMRTSSMEDAENFHKSREYMPEVDERIRTLRTRLITLRIIRDSTFFVMLIGRNFMWMEVAGLGLSLVLVPVLIYFFQQTGQGWVANMVEQQKWQLQKGLVVILTIAAMALAAIKTALTFESKKRKLFKLAEEGKLPKKKKKGKAKVVPKTAPKTAAKAANKTTIKLAPKAASASQLAAAAAKMAASPAKTAAPASAPKAPPAKK